MRRTGRCACGAVRWVTEADPLWSAHCHCESCRRICAAPMTSFIGMRRDEVDWSGELSLYSSSPGVTRAFCPDCGTPMHYESDRWPDETHLYAAALDDPSLYSPTAHVNYAERVPWLTITDDLPKYPGNADDAVPPT